MGRTTVFTKRRTCLRTTLEFDDSYALNIEDDHGILGQILIEKPSRIQIMAIENFCHKFNQSHKLTTITICDNEWKIVISFINRLGEYEHLTFDTQRAALTYYNAE